MYARSVRNSALLVIYASLALALLALVLGPLAQVASALTWTNKTTANGLGSNTVYGVSVSDPHVYAATGNGLSISTGGISFTNKTTTSGLGSNTVYGVFASGSNVYAATGNGLSVSSDSGASFSNKTTANGLGSNTVKGVYAVGANVYAATFGGLSVSTDSGGSFSNKTTANGLGNNLVWGVFASGTNVYAATNGGLSISTDSGNSFTNKTTANGLGSNSVNGVFASGTNVYAATNGGLSISTDSGSSFTNKTTANGLGSNTVSGVFASGSNVYVATASGVGISSDGGSSFTNDTTSNGLGNNLVRGIMLTGSTAYAANDGGLSFASAASNNADLSNLVFEQATLTISFSPVITTYEAYLLADPLSRNHAKETITATVTSPGASLKVNGNGSSGTPVVFNNLGLGDFAIQIIVTAPDLTTTKTYSITLHVLDIGACVALVTSTANKKAPASNTLSKATQSNFDIQVLYNLRDQVMSGTPQGRRYIDLYNANDPDILKALITNPNLMSEGITVLQTWVPIAQTLFNGQSANTTITQPDVDMIVTFLQHLSAAGSPALQQVISQELARTPPSTFVGMTVEQARAMTAGYGLFLPLVVR